MNDAPRVLFIDDDEGLRRLAARILGRRGFAVETAGSGDEGIARARDGAFDLVAVDHYMPGRDGLSTLAEISAMPNPPPVVYVTGSEESRIAVAALKAGAVDYVVKSVGEDFFDLLASAFAQALDTVRLRRENALGEQRLRESHARLEAMLREVNHRVANSLQLVSAFVHLQANSLTDGAAKTALEDTQRRIAAIAQVHKRLYASVDVDTVEMAEYLAALVDELQHTWSTPASPRTILVSAEPVKLKTDQAVSVGIIVNELVSNACKYAYPAEAAGEIRVALRVPALGRFELRVEDDGCGLPADGAPKGTGLGSRLINAMASSLKSTVEYDTAPTGLTARLSASY
ncbi:sensor histidine kinase [Flavisphingomonas formosensis]|uniref:sensor histidine kinase n=1 Tax=Flavisphingomonas formosensis TaxID=861534 RepID=UPI0012F96986|nr:response regulator [Sphingomonas formosensis]